MTHVAAWFLYSIVISSLFGLAAVACESALRGSGRQGRWAWLAAMLSSVLVPFLAWAGLSLGSVSAVPDSAMITLAPLVVGVGGGTAQPGPGLDEALLSMWVAVGSGLLLYLCLSWAAIVRDRRRWRRDIVDGIAVVVTDETGPAVWGIRHPRILLPEWALALESRVRRLMLLHEGEHVRAGDTRLVLTGLLVLAATPWNLPLWWQFRRLQQAVELDCDSRVLRRVPDARRYGALLLEVGRRRSAPVMAVALAEPAGFLERRIRMITSRATVASVRRIGAFAVLAVLLAALAVCTRDPMAVADDVEPPVEVALAEYSDPQPEFTPFTVPPRLQNTAEIQALLERLYPPLLRDAGIGGRARVWFYLDTDGRILKTQVSQRSGYPALDQAALEVASAMRFTPALNRDVPVRVWVSLPIRFSSGSGGPAAEGEIARARLDRQATISRDLTTELESRLDAVENAPPAADPAVREQQALSAAKLREQLTEANSQTRRAEDAVDTPAEPRIEIPPRPGPTAPPPPTAGSIREALTAVEERVELPPLQEQRPDPAKGPAFTPFTKPPRLLNSVDVQAALQREYPPILRDAGIMGKSVVWLFVDETGTVERTQIASQADYPALDEAALRVASTMRFSAAENKGKPVAVWVSIPVTFTTK